MQGTTPEFQDASNKTMSCSNSLPRGRILRSYCRHVGYCVCDKAVNAGMRSIHSSDESGVGGVETAIQSRVTDRVARSSHQAWSEASTSKSSSTVISKRSGSAGGLSSITASASQIRNNGRQDRAKQPTRLASTYAPQRGPRLRGAQSARTPDGHSTSRALCVYALPTIAIVALCIASWIVYDRRNQFGSFTSVDEFVNQSPWTHWTADTSAVELEAAAGDPLSTGRTVARLKDRVSDLAERVDRCAWADQLAELHSRLVHAEGRLSSLSTKSDHSKLQSLIASQTSIFNARSLKLNSRIERLERLMSCKMGAASTPTFFEADLMPNYALKSDGAEVIAENCGGSRSCSLQQRWRQWWRRLPRPDTVLAGGAASGLQPGDCWSFGGFPGRLLIRLSRPIRRVSAVSIDHVSRLLVHKGSVASAPRQFCVFGLAKKCIDSSMRRLGCFTYDADSASLTQTFRVGSAASVTHRDAVSFVLLEVQSNHGHPNFTCVYRFRVHGL